MELKNWQIVTLTDKVGLLRRKIGLVINDKIFYKEKTSEGYKLTGFDYVDHFDFDLVCTSPRITNKYSIDKVYQQTSLYSFQVMLAFETGDLSNLECIWKREDHQIKVYDKTGAEIGYVKKEDINKCSVQ